jgi:hypothetical protein
VTRDQKIAFGKCDRPAFAPSWFIAPTTVRASGVILRPVYDASFRECASGYCGKGGRFHRLQSTEHSVCGRRRCWPAGLLGGGDCDFPRTQQAEGGERMIHSKRPRDSNHLAKSIVGNCFSKGES